MLLDEIVHPTTRMAREPLTPVDDISHPARQAG
jgi:hypothetical protein